jgi:predicted DNA-binding transcriptional regulator AlpA
MDKKTKKRLVLLSGRELRSIISNEMMSVLLGHSETNSDATQINDMSVMDIDAEDFASLIKQLTSDFISDVIGRERKKLMSEVENEKKMSAGLISRKQMATELKVSLPTLRKWTVKKFIPNHVKIGGVVYYDREQVISFLNNKKSKNGN